MTRHRSGDARGLLLGCFSDTLGWYYAFFYSPTVVLVTFITNPSFCHLHVIFRIPSALVNPGLADVVHRVRGGPRPGPGSWWPPLARGMRPSRFVHTIA